MTIAQVVAKFKNVKPESVEEALMKCRVSMRYIACGAFRSVYRIDDLPLVAKFALSDDLEQNIAHAVNEYKAIHKIIHSRHRKYRALQKYMPVVYYFNAHTGVTLMREYKPLLSKDWKAIDGIGALVATTLDRHKWDNQTWNYGTDKRGRIVLLDLGVLGPNNEWL